MAAKKKAKSFTVSFVVTDKFLPSDGTDPITRSGVRADVLNALNSLEVDMYVKASKLKVEEVK